MTSARPDILTIIGARPQFIKAAPVSAALRACGLREILIHTGQHFDANMSDVFFDELGIPAPDIHLDIHGGGHGEMTGRMLQALEPVMQAEKPCMVLVYGDTNSTLAGALAAAKLHIPVAHVEAGMRSFNRRMPEEINRVMADHVSTLLFCSTQDAAAHLANEGIREGVHVVGDVMYDMTLQILDCARQSEILARLDLAPHGYAAATIHRAENTDDPAVFRAVMDYLARMSAEQQVVLPLHPRTRQVLAQSGIALPPSVRVIEPLGYRDMAWLMHNAALILTDSGGMQKEAYFHRVPCVTLRTETEWTETVAAGWNRLWSSPDYAQPRRDIPDYGAGDSAQKIVDILAAYGARAKAA